MNSAGRIPASKPDRTVHTMAPEASGYGAIVLMAQRNIGALVVTEGERIAGIVSERDYSRYIVLKSRSSNEAPVRDIMTAKVLYVHPDQKSEERIRINSGSRVRHLRVIDGDRLVGLLSIGGLVKDIISEQRFALAGAQECPEATRGPRRGFQRCLRKRARRFRSVPPQGLLF